MSDSNNMQVDSTENDQIDEGLYSRQLYVLGKEAMLKMQHSNVLIIGLKGLGVEIAKNVALAGVKSLTLCDPGLVTIEDLSSQFFLSEEDIGKPRALATAPKLTELNQYTPITVISNLNQLGSYQVIVSTGLSLEENLKINEFTHANDIKFVIAEVRGLFANVFVDFGDKFTVYDQTGEEVHSGIVSDIESDGTVTMLDDYRHGLEDGDWVKFSEVQGLEKLNDGTLYQIEVLGPYAFKIKFDPSIGKYKKGGLYTQVKVPKDFKFEPLKKQLEEPEYLFADYAKFDRPPQYHLGFQALQIFELQNGRSPAPHSDADALSIIAITKDLKAKHPSILGEEEVNEKLITELAYQAKGDIPGMVAFVGGLVAQEALKACSGKFVPVKQWLYFDSLESLPSSEEYPRTEETCKPINSRYDNQIAVFGLSFQKKIANLKVFLVGSGAIGCEMLKNWAMMGLASGPDGKIVITDMDSIEKSNLNRQFLFRPKDVGKNKSECAALAVAVMNPELTNKIEAKLEKVGPETEHIFNKKFWEGLDLVTNALDNVDARTYVDRRCVFFKKPLLESGTLGTKGNTQVIIPNLTESYSSSQDPPEKSIPLCTLRSFPNKIDHTIAWAKSLFQGYFADAPENVNLYLSQPNFVEATLKQSGDIKGILETISDYLKKRPYTFEECIKWARLEFEKKFSYDIKQLLYNFPKDATTSSGEPFWSGAKRAPNLLEFDINNDDHFHFIVAGANLLAFIYGLKGDEGEADKSFYAKVLNEVEVPPFTPLSNLKIQVNDSDPDPNAEAGSVDNDIIQQITNSLPSPSTLAGYRLTPVEFEKDDDSNHHIEFISAASNCRALNYAIETVDALRTKFIAGRIIPAIATTTALVTGLVCLELYKVVDGKTDIEQYRNGFANLALPFFAFSEPIASPQGKYNDKTFDVIWGRFDLYGDMTLQEFLDYFHEKEGLDISMLSYGVSLLYASFYAPKKLKERYPMKLTELIKDVSKKEVPPYESTLIFEICADDKEGEDVEIPYAAVHLDK